MSCWAYSAPSRYPVVSAKTSTINSESHNAQRIVISPLHFPNRLLPGSSCMAASICGPRRNERHSTCTRASGRESCRPSSSRSVTHWRPPRRSLCVPPTHRTSAPAAPRTDRSHPEPGPRSHRVRRDREAKPTWSHLTHKQSADPNDTKDTHAAFSLHNKINDEALGMGSESVCTPTSPNALRCPSTAPSEPGRQWPGWQRAPASAGEPVGLGMTMPPAATGVALDGAALRADGRDCGCHVDAGRCHRRAGPGPPSMSGPIGSGAERLRIRRADQFPLTHV